jgi:ribose/xylose/arabinose/galactoside ABC-type transport system permease subunit
MDTVMTRVTGTAIVRRFGLWFVFVLVCAGLSIASPTFRTQLNLENILQQNAVIGIVACGMTVMMIAGGFDLSVGAVGAAAAVTGAVLSNHHGAWVVIPAGLGVGLGIGLINGTVISRLKVNAFIATLSMSSILSGQLFVATGAAPEEGKAGLLDHAYNGRLGSVPIVFVVFLCCLVAVWLFLTRTKYGHYVYSVGGNAEASMLSGVPVQRIQTLAFALGGVFAAGGGLLLLGQADVGQPGAAVDWPLNAIAICVVGGVGLAGGVGRIQDVFIATLLLGVIANGLNQLNVSAYWQPTVTGLVILAAVVVEQLNRTRQGGLVARRRRSAPSVAAPAEPAATHSAVPSELS